MHYSTMCLSIQNKATVIMKEIFGDKVYAKKNINSINVFKLNFINFSS